MSSTARLGSTPSMSSFISRLIHGRALSSDDLIRPFSQRIKQALLEDNLHTAVAFLTKAIEIAPERLDLVLMRAQVLQYGLSNFSSALKDYRYVLSELGSQSGSRAREQVQNWNARHDGRLVAIDHS